MEPTCSNSFSLCTLLGKKLATENSVTNWRSKYFKAGGDLDLFMSDGKRLRSHRLQNSHLALFFDVKT